MNRRTLLCGLMGMLTSPIAAQAQQAVKITLIGLLALHTPGKFDLLHDSPTSATGTAWKRTPWHAMQRAAWEALAKAEEANRGRSEWMGPVSSGRYGGSSNRKAGKCGVRCRGPMEGRSRLLRVGSTERCSAGG